MKKNKPTLVNKEYRLMDSRSGESFVLKVGRNRKLLYFDEDKGYNRAIRHCPNEKSIFIDEQSEHALVEPIIFIKGSLEVKKEYQSTQKFLECHPDNGRWFEEINEEIEAGEDIELEELIAEIKQEIREKGDEEDGIYALEMLAANIKGSVEAVYQMSKSELKRVIYQEVDRDPYYFTDDSGNITVFDNDYLQLRYLALRAIKDGIIKKSPNKKSISWVKGGNVIATAPQGTELIDYFTEFLSTDEGILVIEEIKKRT